MSAGRAFWLGIVALLLFAGLGLFVACTVGLFTSLWGITGAVVAAAVWAFPSVITWTWWFFRSEYEKDRI